MWPPARAVVLATELGCELAVLGCRCAVPRIVAFVGAGDRPKDWPRAGHRTRLTRLRPEIALQGAAKKALMFVRSARITQPEGRDSGVTIAIWGRLGPRWFMHSAHLRNG